ncbi:MAG TPA: FtsX-like permease family protein [Gammaproteobacteria bacterium]|nr:FtsX-like permease family protein [Gammaproteobacteria bacterium]
MIVKLAWRLLFARGRLATLLAGVAVGGIALGVLVLTTVLAVMSGFESVLSQKLVALGAEITVTPPNGNGDWQALAKRLEAQPQVVAAAPSLIGQALLLHDGQLAPVAVRGISAPDEARVSDLDTHLVAGKLSELRPGSRGLIVGEALAQTLKLQAGDSLTLLTARAGRGDFGFTPALARYKVLGIYRLGIYKLEQSQVYTDLADARALFPEAGAASVALRLAQPLEAPAVAGHLRAYLGARYAISDWTQNQADLFATIGLEKRMLFVVLAAILAVAAFTVVATLLVSGLDREPDIAVLKTLGFTPRRIASVFLVQGLVLGAVGTAIGLGLGAALALNVNRLLGALDHVFHTQLLPPSIYLISELPARFHWQEILATAIVAIVLSLAAAVYPALQSARRAPAEALRYE